jgi:hypothetical protein
VARPRPGSERPDLLPSGVLDHLHLFEPEVGDRSSVRILDHDLERHRQGRGGRWPVLDLRGAPVAGDSQAEDDGCPEPVSDPGSPHPRTHHGTSADAQAAA